ncbi:hypothetical protein [Paenibacillus spongiae]|uniref:Uncharacterized protein n=1 Tax=Paenibacillus spongiae TaxID=2909671 RepID=A0ABY5S882_9BACL|nr:hypothetical protein [Paenibacillus spongiae]UVI28740.1 hypothetical protein L1F29_25360 [Paenibacillus spongiae]
MTHERRIYVLLTDTGTLFTRMIRMVTRFPLNHASIAFDSDLKQVYSFGRKNPNNPLIGGFVKENVYDEWFDNAQCAVFSCMVDANVYYQMQEQMEWYERNQEKYKYNLLGLFGVVFNKEIERSNAYFCSQFVATVFEKNGLALADKTAGLVTPGDICQSKSLQLEYIGVLRDYTSLVLNESSFVRTA